MRGMHGSVGTQNEKLIHAVLKNYYAPYSDDQEVRIGKFFADAVTEEGIFEIQTRHLYVLKEKLKAFTEASRVTIVHPMEVLTRNVYVDSDTGEVLEETPFRRMYRKLALFEELYSIRDFLSDSRLTIIIAKLKTYRLPRRTKAGYAQPLSPQEGADNADPAGTCGGDKNSASGWFARIPAGGAA